MGLPGEPADLHCCLRSGPGGLLNGYQDGQDALGRMIPIEYETITQAVTGGRGWLLAAMSSGAWKSD